ncbi:radical SAM protein [Halobacteriovorax marinus]|uniref:radical SAM protein n=1 Tax=Halobacteriovorax marinus TaxID=97084 RepID=UPI003A93F28A
MMPKVEVPNHYNYIGVFLSLSCNLSCSYCINHTVGLNQRRKHLNGKQWAQALNRLQTKTDLPITIQGGEPTIHKDFYEIINSINPEKKIDLLTNIQFDTSTFINTISKDRFCRSLPYPAIRVSYHPETMDLENTITKVKELQDNQYSIGLFTVDHPHTKDELEHVKKRSLEEGILFKTKEFLGKLDGKVYGNYHYKDAIFSSTLKTVNCRTSELLISPEGFVYRCHHDLYNKKSPIGDILSPNFKIEDKYTVCDYYGKCNPCDIKLKNNRFQEFGHCSVHITEV